MRLDEWRHTKDLTIRELAPLVGATPSYLSDLEHGRVRPPENSAIWVGYACIDGVLTEADFRAMGTIEPPKGESFGFSCGPGLGCKQTRFVDGKEAA